MRRTAISNIRYSSINTPLLGSNKIAAHYRNHKLIKGKTLNFFHNKPHFDIETLTFELSKVDIEELKAIFFIKKYEGNKYRKDNYSHGICGAGRKMRVEFFDGEVVIGYALSYSADRQGFFLTPADAGGNNERIFVVNSSTTKVSFV